MTPAALPADAAGPAVVRWIRLSGRGGRQEFWLLVVVLPWIAGTVLGLLVKPVAQWMDGGAEARAWVVAIAVLLLVFALSAVSICAGVRRMHDLGRSGWWVLLNAVPLVNLGMLVWQGFYKGMPGPNAYGPDPLQRQPAAQRWVLLGQGGQYAQCEFPLQEPIVFGTDARHAAIVIDARRYPDIEPAHCQLRPPAGVEPARLYWPDGAGRFERRDPDFDGRQLDLGSGLRFTVQAAPTAEGTP